MAKATIILTFISVLFVSLVFTTASSEFEQIFERCDDIGEGAFGQVQRCRVKQRTKASASKSLKIGEEVAVKFCE